MKNRILLQTTFKIQRKMFKSIIKTNKPWLSIECNVVTKLDTQISLFEILKGQN